MSDLLSRTEPVPTAAFVADGVTISLAPPMARFSLRARQGQALETLLGVEGAKKDRRDRRRRRLPWPRRMAAAR